MQGWERSLVARLEERGQAITDLKAQLAALDTSPVTREVPTAYLR